MQISSRLIYHLIASFVIVPFLLLGFFVPVLNIPIFLLIGLLSLPFGIALEVFGGTFAKAHFSMVFIGYFPDDFIGWTLFVIYFLVIFNLFAWRFGKSRSKNIQASSQAPL